MLQAMIPQNAVGCVTRYAPVERLETVRNGPGRPLDGYPVPPCKLHTLRGVLWVREECERVFYGCMKSAKRVFYELFC